MRHLAFASSFLGMYLFIFATYMTDPGADLPLTRIAPPVSPPLSPRTRPLPVASRPPLPSPPARTVRPPRDRLGRPRPQPRPPAAAGSIDTSGDANAQYRRTRAPTPTAGTARASR